MENKLLVIDIETTGFTYKTGFIVEVGMVELNLENGEIKTVFDSVCRHQNMTAKDREAWIFKNSNLTVDKVRKSPLFDDIKDEIQSIVNKYTLGATAFNRNFDINFLTGNGIKFGKLQPCPMLLLTPIMKLTQKSGRGIKWPKVEEAMPFLFADEDDYVEAHRGAEDARDEAQIIYEMYRKGMYKIEN